MRPRLRSVWIGAFFAGLVHAQVDTVEQRIRVEGRVTALNGEAVAGAIVRLRGVASRGEPVSTYSQSTDGDGRFAFGDAEPGIYTLTSEKLGFVTHPYGARSDDSPAAQLALDAGSELKDLSLTMTPLGIVYGRVTDQEGKPVAKAQMSIYRSVSAGARQPLVSAGLYDGLGATDNQGNYRVSYLASGRYYVKAAPPSPVNVLARGNSGPPSQTLNVATFYPNAADAEGAAPVDVEAGGEVRGIDIRLSHVRVYSIRGRAILAATGDPVPGVRLLEIVQVPGAANATVSSTLLGSALTGPDGSFEMQNLRPGRHLLQVIATGTVSLSSGGVNEILAFRTGPGVEPRATGRVEVTIDDSDVNDVVVQLTKGSVLSGTIRLEDGGLDGLRPQQSIRLIPSDGGTLNTPSGLIEANGTFEIHGVVPMKYFPYISGLPQGVYVKSIRLGGEDVTRASLDLTSAASGSLEIVLSPKAAELAGTVRNDRGDPVAGVVVTLRPKIPDGSDATGGIKTVPTDGGGGFKILGLAPGDYFVTAGETSGGDALAVKLEEGGHQRVDVKVR